jgi:hypothetical protein
MFIRKHLTVDPAAPGARMQAVHLGIVDPMFAVTGNVPTPYSENDYAVECKIDAAAGFTPCLDDGILRVLRSPGDHEVQVRVTAPDGAVSNDLVRWRVLTPPTTFDVRQPSGAHRAGSRVRAVAVGLLPHESYTITMAGHTLATGSADAHGKVDRSVVLPRSVKAGQRSLVVTGATKLRRGHHIVRIVVGHTGATTARALGAPI